MGTTINIYTKQCSVNNKSTLDLIMGLSTCSNSAQSQAVVGAVVRLLNRDTFKQLYRQNDWPQE